MSTEYTKVCIAGFYTVGLQPWEDVQSVFRVICTLVTVSIVSSWFSRRGIGRLMLLFLHWLGGLVHLLSGIVMAQMVLDCWVGAELLSFIKALKFFELAGSNLVAVTNLAICANLALIVHSHRTMTRIKSMSSLRMVLFFLILSVGAAGSAMPYWERWLVTGTTFILGGTTPARNDWIMISYFMLEGIVSVVMTVIVVLLLLFRRSELRQVWRLHRRIKYHVALTVIALLVNIAITASGILILLDDAPFTLIIMSWILRYVHIALDTLVLYSALETPVFHLEITSQASAGSSLHPQSVLRY